MSNMNVGGSHGGANDTLQWLQVRLGGSDKTWSDVSIAPHFTKELLVNIYDCFLDLPAPMKTKLLLSFLHITRRSLETLRPELENIIALAIQDPDQWVSLTAELLKDFPSKGEFNTNIVRNSSMFNGMRNDIKKHLRRLSERSVDLHFIPYESEFMNKKAFTATFGNVAPPAKHFTLKQKPKSATLRADALAKASEAVRPKNQSGSGLPIRFKEQTKTLDTIFSQGTMSTAAKKAYAAGPHARVLAAKEKQLATAKARGGVKILDVAPDHMEMPGGHKRRKKMVGIPVTAAGEAKEPEEQSEHMDVAAEKEKPKVLSPRSDEAVEPTSSQSQDASTVPIQSSQSPAMSSPEMPKPVDTPISSPLASTSAIRPLSPEIAPPRPPVNVPVIVSQPPLPQVRMLASPPRNPVPLPAVNTMNMPQLAPQAFPSGESLGAGGLQQNTAAPSTSAATPDVPALGLGLAALSHPDLGNMRISKEMEKTIREIFATANRVTRPEKLLILKFISGDRKNPFPHLGPVLTVRLSENPAVTTLSTGQQIETVAEDYFHMNFETGAWKRLRKHKPVHATSNQNPSVSIGQTSATPSVIQLIPAANTSSGPSGSS